MKSKNLSKKELKKINGGASFAYRVGQIIRGSFMSITPAGYAQFVAEAVVNEMYLND